MPLEKWKASTKTAGRCACRAMTRWGRACWPCSAPMPTRTSACGSPWTARAHRRMALYDVPAPAKLNLFLHVVGRRADGYHLLQTVFRFIDLGDSLDFDLCA